LPPVNKHSIGSAEDVRSTRPRPICCDPDRIADAATIRRWFWRRIQSPRFLNWMPTLFAWDWRAVARILIAEPISP